MGGNLLMTGQSARRDLLYNKVEIETRVALLDTEAINGTERSQSQNKDQQDA